MRKFFKRAISLSMVAAMGATMVACNTSDSKDSTTEKDDKTEAGATTEASAPEDIEGDLTILTHRTDLIDTKFADYVTEFTAKYPNVTVSFEPITDYEGDVAIRMSTDEYGDVLMLPQSIQSNDFAEYFEPLGTVEELSAKYDEKFLYAKQSEGVVYGLASCANAQGVVYNKQVFKDAGITKLPTTPEEFLADLQLIKDNTEAIPYYTNYSAGWPLTAWEDHCWGSVTGNDMYHNNEIVTEEAPFSKGTSHYTVYKLMYDIVSQDLCEEDPTTSDWESSKGMLNRGEIGCMMLGSWAISQMQAADANPDNIGYMAFPSNIDGTQYATAGADYCYGINKNSENKEAARAWIDFMIDESGFALSEGSISIKLGDPMPDTLSDFTNVTLVVDKAATAENEGKIDALSEASEVGFYVDTEKKRIVEAAMGSTDESFDDIMADWNARWADALAE